MTADAARAELAPGRPLRVGLNLGNSLLVKAAAPQGSFEGIVPQLARALAGELGVQFTFVPFPSPGPLGDAVAQGACDLGFLADEPQRAATIAFTPAYLEIVASYLVPPGSPLRSVEQVDQPGVRVVTVQRSAYDLFLQRNLKHAQRVAVGGADEAFQVFVEQKLECLSGLQTRLFADQARLPGSTVLPGGFTQIRQAIGTARDRPAAAEFLRGFVQRAKASGLVQQAIDAHAIQGVRVAAG